MAINSQPNRHSDTLRYLPFVLLVLFIIVVHTLHFQGHNYRQDEAWVVHHALEQIEQHGLIGHISRIYSEFTADYLSLDIWVGLFGQVEPIVRFLATLNTVLALALLFRLAADLFDKQTALLAVFILGTLGFYQFFSHEARPYAALVLNTVGFQLSFLRFVRRPRWQYGILAIFFADFMLLQHSFMLYVVAAHALFIILFVPWNRRVYALTFVLFAVIGLIYLPRYLVIVSDDRYAGGIGYALSTTADSLVLLHDQMQMRPQAIGQLLLITGLLLPARRLFNTPLAGLRFSIEWRKWYLIVIPLGILAITFTINSFLPSITPRNLIIIVPSLAILAAFALRQFPWQAVLTTAILILIPFLTTFPTFVSNAGYREIADYLTAHYRPDNSRIVVMAGILWEHVPIIYYVRERTPFNLANEDLFHIVGEQREHYPTIPAPPVNIAWDDSEANQAAFLDYIGIADHVWVIRGVNSVYTPTYLDLLAEHYIALGTVTMDGDTYYFPLTITEYRRIPDDAAESARFGDIGLQAWTVVDGVTVQACQSVTVESWWLAHVDLPIDYSMTLVLTDTDGNPITNTDGQPAGIQTQLWTPDRYYLDERALTIPCETQPGDYLLLTGIYDPTNPTDSNPVYLTTLRVSE